MPVAERRADVRAAQVGRREGGRAQRNWWELALRGGDGKGWRGLEEGAYGVVINDIETFSCAGFFDPFIIKVIAQQTLHRSFPSFFVFDFIFRLQRALQSLLGHLRQIRIRLVGCVPRYLKSIRIVSIARQQRYVVALATARYERFAPCAVWFERGGEGGEAGAGDAGHGWGAGGGVGSGGEGW